VSVAAPPPVASPPAEHSDGVIKEAREQQMRRHKRRASVVVALLLLSVAAWLVAEASSKASPRSHHAPAPPAPAVGDPASAAFDVRLWPYMHGNVGVAGYCEAVEESGRTGVSACGGVPTASEPLVIGVGYGQEGGPSTHVAVTLPEVASVLVNGVRRVPTLTVRGLPFGLRAVRVRTSRTSETERLSPPIKTTVRRRGFVLVPLNAQGQKLAEHPIGDERQAQVLVWGHGSPEILFSRGALAHPPSNSPCELAVNGLPDLTARAGLVATDIRPFPGKVVGEAFLPCIETQYQLGREPVRALVMLNAADPSGHVGNMPGFTPVPGAAGFFTEGGTLTAKRVGNAWLVVGQGSSLSQRLEVLRHLSATVRL